MHEVDPVIAALIFATSLSIDAVGTYSVQKIQKNESLPASLSSVACTVLGSILLYYFIENPAYLAIECLGGGIGTYLMCERAKRLKVTNNEKS